MTTTLKPTSRSRKPRAVKEEATRLHSQIVRFTKGPHCQVWQLDVNAAPTLFDTLPPRRAATLEETRLRDQQILVLEALVDAQRRDPIGHHAFGLQTWLRERDMDRGIERNAIGSRFRELDKWFGFVVKVGERTPTTGRSEKVYAPTADGIAWVAQRRVTA